MGWLYAQDSFVRKKETIELLTAPSFWKQGCKVVAHRTVGNHLWILLEFNNVRSIVLALLRSGGRTSDGGWGYKIIDEECGPLYYDCPLSLLKQASETANANSIAWREQVKKHHALKASLPKPESGMTVVYGGNSYRLHSPAGRRRGWYVVAANDCGSLMRMKANQLSQALRDKAIAGL